MTDHTSILLEIRNEQERQRGVLEAIKEKLGVLSAPEDLDRLSNGQQELLGCHARRGQSAVKNFRAGKGAKQRQGGKAS